METWAVASGHPTATRAAERILRAGGNAVDAGVAAGLTLGVVQPDLVSVAGVAPIIMFDAATGQVTSQDGVGGWPAAADVEAMHRAHGNHVPEGILRTVIPAAPASWIRALSEKGTLRFADIAEEALKAAATASKSTRSSPTSLPPGRKNTPASPPPPRSSCPEAARPWSASASCSATLLGHWSR